jgi:hypothetical protein
MSDEDRELELEDVELDHALERDRASAYSAELWPKTLEPGPLPGEDSLPGPGPEGDIPVHQQPELPLTVSHGAGEIEEPWNRGRGYGHLETILEDSPIRRHRTYSPMNRTFAKGLWPDDAELGLDHELLTQTSRYG